MTNINIHSVKKVKLTKTKRRELKGGKNYTTRRLEVTDQNDHVFHIDLFGDTLDDLKTR